MITILGAGAVGLSLGARLTRAGHDVLFVTRRAEATRALCERGVAAIDLEIGEVWHVPVRAVTGLAAAASEIEDGPLLLCVRAPGTEDIAAELHAVAPGATVVSVQNHHDNEAILARRFERVLGVAFRQTCTRRGDNEVVFAGGGRLVIGAHPKGAGADVEALAADLRAAGYDVGVSERIAEDKWLKMCVNLMSAPNALVRREDHETQAFVETKARVLEEAREILRLAGIRARSCDGRDRSLDDEIRHQRESLARGTSARRLPVYNQVWAALSDGGPQEADHYHQTFLDLAAEHGVAAPTNRRVLRALRRAHDEGRGPECVTASSLLVD